MIDSIKPEDISPNKAMSYDGMCPTCGMRLKAGKGKAPRCARCDAGQIRPGHPGTQAFTATPMPAPPPATVDEWDDSSPYAITESPNPTLPCLKCKKQVPQGAILCNHCGYNQQTGETLRLVYDKIDRCWESGSGFGLRFGIFLGIQGVALLATAIVIAVDGSPTGFLVSWLVGATFLSFILGTYPRTDLTRSKQGRVRMSRTWRVCFIPMSTREVNWRPYGGVLVSRSPATDAMDWVMLFFLAPWGLIPAFIWWRVIIEPDQFDVALTRDHGYPALLLYRGRNEAQAKEMAATLRTIMGYRQA